MTTYLNIWSLGFKRVHSDFQVSQKILNQHKFLASLGSMFAVYTVSPFLPGYLSITLFTMFPHSTLLPFAPCPQTLSSQALGQLLRRGPTAVEAGLAPWAGWQ